MSRSWDGIRERVAQDVTTLPPDQQAAWDEVLRKMDDGKRFHCPICFDGFDDHREKDTHLEALHGFTVLEVKPAAWPPPEWEV